MIQAVEDLGELDNTLIIYIGGDNGASAEGMLNGTPNEFTTFNGVAVPVKDQLLWYPFWGSERTFPHFAAGWAWAMDTPFKWVKQVPSHFGGTAQGVVMSWPGHITDTRRHPPAVLPRHRHRADHPRGDRHPGAATRSTASSRRRSKAPAWPTPGTRRTPTRPTRHTTQYFEMLGNRAIYHDGWVAATTPATLPWELSTATPPDVITGYKWELYNVDEDPTQADDLAAKMPDKLKELQDLFYSEATKYNVLPLDNSTLARWNAPRPNLTAGRTEFTYSGELSGMPASAAPSILEQVLHHHRRGRDPRGRRRRDDRHRRRALRRLRPVPEQGRVRRRPRQGRCSSTTCSTSSAPMWEGPELEPGKHTIVFDFKSDGAGLGKGGTGVLSVDGKEVARNTLDHTTPITFPEDETFDVGLDTRTAARAGRVSLRLAVPVHRQDRQADLRSRARRS